MSIHGKSPKFTIYNANLRHFTQSFYINLQKFTNFDI